mgnify:FL=1
MTATNGSVFYFMEEFGIIEMSKEVIIGLPSIISHILPLFVQSLLPAKEIFQGKKYSKPIDNSVKGDLERVLNLIID